MYPSPTDVREIIKVLSLLSAGQLCDPAPNFDRNGK